MGAPVQRNTFDKRVRYPLCMRVGAVFGAVVLGLMAAVVPSRARLVLPKWSRASRWLVWAIVAYGVAGLVLDVVTPSGASAPSGHPWHSCCWCAVW